MRKVGWEAGMIAFWKEDRYRGGGEFEIVETEMVMREGAVMMPFSTYI